MYLIKRPYDLEGEQRRCITHIGDGETTSPISEEWLFLRLSINCSIDWVAVCSSIRPAIQTVRYVPFGSAVD